MLVVVKVVATFVSSIVVFIIEVSAISFFKVVVKINGDVSITVVFTEIVVKVEVFVVGVDVFICSVVGVVEESEVLFVELIIETAVAFEEVEIIFVVVKRVVEV